MDNLYVGAEIITELRSLRSADHIAVSGNIRGVQYFHHGIFLGPYEGVADFSGDKKKNARPRIVDILIFKGDRELIRYLYKPTECLPPENVVKNAKDLVDNPEKWKAYNLLQSNCEHFATWCKVGEAVSYQVLKKIRELGYALLKVVGASIVPQTPYPCLSASGVSFCSSK